MENNTHEFDPDEAQALARKYLCSACYGELTVRYNPKSRTSAVTCQTKDCNCPGFVTRRFVEKAKAKNAGEAAEARCVLSQAVPWMKNTKTADQLLAELGF
jgi:hypothetical protein